MSDITLADFWGIQNVLPEMDDDKGTSLVLLHSAKGKALWEKIIPQLQAVSVDAQTALKSNPAMTESAQPHHDRGDFFSHIDDVPFQQLVTQYARQQKNLKAVLLQILRKLGLLTVAKSLVSKK